MAKNNSYKIQAIKMFGFIKFKQLTFGDKRSQKLMDQEADLEIKEHYHSTKTMMTQSPRDGKSSALKKFFAIKWMF